ncbi:phage tail-collar fiber domain-containing protein [Paenibacillus sp. Marseille-Q9583]
MAVFGGMTITIKGLALQGKAQAGAKLEYTRVAIGDGSLNGQSMPALNGLISQKMVLPITRIRAQPPNKATIGSVVDNASVTSGFYFREIGLFATDPDVGEILYAYANSGVTADYIPPGGGSDIIEKVFDIDVVIGTAANISAKIDDSLVFTQKKEFLAHVDNATAHITAAERVAWNAAETNAKNASIPKTEKGVAGGVAALDATKLMLSDGAMLNGRVVERVFNFSFANGVANQKIDVILPVNGGVYEIEVIGSFNTINTAGKLVKRFNGTYSNPASYPTGSQYTEVTGVVKSHISIGEPFFDSDLKWRVPLESRTTAPNPFTVIVRVLSGGGAATAPTLSAVYTGTAGTTLPVAVQTIPDDTKTQSGYLLQKHKLTENDGKVIRLAPSTDLNTVNRNGQYDGYPLVNAPGNNTGAWFFIEVFSHSQNPDSIFFQRATTFATVPRSYIRECYNSVWGEWTEEENASRKNVANGYAGLDSSAKLIDALVPLNVARKATEITISGTDLNTLGEGEYLCPSNALALTFLNMPPTKTAFHLKVSKHAGFNQTFTTFNTVATGGDRLRIFSRNIYNGVFGAWVEIESTNVKGVADGYAGLDSSVKVPRVNTYSSLGGASVTQITNLDTMLTAGVYPTIQNPTGAPENFFGMLRVTVDSGEAGNGGNWVLQEWMGQAGGNRYTRLKINALAWTAWIKQWDSFNDAPLFTTRGTVSNNTDYNTLVKNGIYMIYNPTGTTNSSPAAYGILTVSTNDPSNVSNSYIKQEVIEAATGTIYSRSKYSPTSWTPWVSNVSSAGGTMTGVLAKIYNSNIIKYHNLAGYYEGNTNSVTGTIKITLPVGYTSAMLNIKIRGYNYTASGGSWELNLGGYNFSGGSWGNVSAEITGKPPFNNVRFAYDGSKCCILLGATSTIWAYPQIEISEVVASHSGASGLGSGWTIGIITSETGITGVNQPTLSYGNANTLNGYAPSVMPSPNTIALRDAKGEIAGVSSTLSKVDDTPIAKSSAGLMALNYNVTGTDQTLTVSAYLSLMSASNFSMYISYTDPRLGLKNYEICPLKRLEGEAYVFVPAFIRAKAGTEVRLMVVHSDDAFPAYITASIGKG